MAKSPCLMPSITSEPRFQPRMVPLKAWKAIDMAITKITIATSSSSRVNPYRFFRCLVLASTIRVLEFLGYAFGVRRIFIHCDFFEGVAAAFRPLDAGGNEKKAGPLFFVDG